jgi:hypothetical protein
MKSHYSTKPERIKKDKNSDTNVSLYNEQSSATYSYKVKTKRKSKKERAEEERKKKEEEKLERKKKRKEKIKKFLDTKVPIPERGKYPKGYKNKRKYGVDDYADDFDTNMIVPF